VAKDTFGFTLGSHFDTSVPGTFDWSTSIQKSSDKKNSISPDMDQDGDITMDMADNDSVPAQSPAKPFQSSALTVIVKLKAFTNF
jgi:hypothetical protein